MELVLFSIGVILLVFGGIDHAGGRIKAEIQNGVTGSVYLILSYVLGSGELTDAIRAILMIYGIFNIGITLGRATETLRVKGSEAYKKLITASNAMVQLQKDYYTIHKEELEKRK